MPRFITSINPICFFDGSGGGASSAGFLMNVGHSYTFGVDPVELAELISEPVVGETACSISFGANAFRNFLKRFERSPEDCFPNTNCSRRQIRCSLVSLEYECENASLSI